jgi:site-specific DNA-methyltransferase (adenine-specific)
VSIKRLYYGDNLKVLRESIPDESVDLIYLDPPFNSKATYNVLFKGSGGDRAETQITAFEDTWTWSIQSEQTLVELQRSRGELAQLLDLLIHTLGQNSLSAYLVMMAIRLVELHRVLRKTGSLYLHCDTVASHYLKMMLDIIFGAKSFRNEIIWQRTNAHSDSKTWSRVSDSIFFYTKSQEFCWNPIYVPHDSQYIADKYRHVDVQGRRYRLGDMTSPSPRPRMMYEWKGHPHPINGWRFSQETMAKLDAQGRIWYPKNSQGRPQLKRYLDEMPGNLMGNIWTDISPINSQASERLGYPTQKPLALLERILSASSNPGDVVLDPFCGCGTAVHAAERLGRQWIGIDMTHLAISLVEKRLRDAFPRRRLEEEDGTRLVAGVEFEVEGTPKDLSGAQDLFDRDPYQFQWWACSLVNAQPFQQQKKGADGGVDGVIYFSDLGGEDRTGNRRLKPRIKKIVVSIKGGKNVGVAMVRDLRGTMATAKAEMGLFLTLTAPTKAMVQGAAQAGFYRAGNGRDYPRLQLLTIADLLEGRSQPEFFDMSLGELTFKRAQREAVPGQQLSIAPPPPTSLAPPDAMAGPDEDEDDENYDDDDFLEDD